MVIIQIEDYYGNPIAKVQVEGQFNLADMDTDSVTGESVMRVQREDK